MALITSSIYLLPGWPAQPSNFLVAVVIALAFVAGPGIIPTAALLALVWLAYVFIVSATWWTVERDPRFLLTAYYGFDLMTKLKVASMMMTRTRSYGGRVRAC